MLHRRRRCQLGLALVLSSCHAKAQPVEPEPPPRVPEPSPREPEPEPPPEPFAWQHEPDASTAGEFALISSGTPLWTSPKAREPVATAMRHGAVEVVGRADGFVEVALDWRPDSAAVYCWPPVYPLALRVFVHEDDLHDVVVAAHVVDFGDGTGLNIAPGTSVQTSSEGLLLSARSAGRVVHLRGIGERAGM